MTTTLDAKGLICPLPVLRARKSLRQVAPSGQLCILATDEAALEDFAAFCREAGHELVEQAEPEPGVFAITIRKKKIN